MKFLPGPPGGAASGSFGGVTASHNRYGSYLRSRVIPTNPSSQRQQEIRNYLTDLAAMWTNILSQAQRTAWDAYGAAITKYDSLGQPYTLPGFNWFVGNNTCILQCGGSVVLDGPTILNRPGADPLFVATCSEASQLININFNDTVLWCDTDESFLQIKLSRPGSPGRSYFQGPYRYAGNIPGSSVSPPTTPDSSLTAPWVVTEGQITTCVARIVREDGRTSAEFKSTTAVVA